MPVEVIRQAFLCLS